MRLNLGSGTDYREGWTNMDAYAKQADVRHDMCVLPWPFENESFEYVFASHVLEHVPTLFFGHGSGYRDVLFAIMEELHRVLKPGGVLAILVPKARTINDTMHPNHYRHFEPESFAYLANVVKEESYHSARFELVQSKVQWSRDPGRNPAMLRDWRLRGLPIFEHVRLRLPWTYKLVSRRGEICAILRKPEA